MTLPAPAFSASHSTPLDVLRCMAFDVWTRGSPSPLSISTSVSSTFSLTHSPLRIAIPLVPTVRHSPSILIMSHGELPPILYLDSDIFIFERLRSIVPFNSWGRLPSASDVWPSRAWSRLLTYAVNNLPLSKLKLNSSPSASKQALHILGSPSPRLSIQSEEEAASPPGSRLRATQQRARIFSLRSSSAHT